MPFRLFVRNFLSVMAGLSRLKDGVAYARLCPAIHAYCSATKDVDARHRRQVYAVCAKQTAMAGHDEVTPRAD
jgi:hypothetical protein